MSGFPGSYGCLRVDTAGLRERVGLGTRCTVDKLRVDKSGWAMGDLMLKERDKIGVPVYFRPSALRTESPTQAPLMARNACIHTAPALPCSCLLATAVNASAQGVP